MSPLDIEITELKEKIKREEEIRESIQKEIVSIASDKELEFESNGKTDIYNHLNDKENELRLDYNCQMKLIISQTNYLTALINMKTSTIGKQHLKKYFFYLTHSNSFFLGGGFKKRTMISLISFSKLKYTFEIYSNNLINF